jgi:hypothetical protein
VTYSIHLWKFYLHWLWKRKRHLCSLLFFLFLVV